MAITAGTTEIADSEEEPMTSSPVNVSDGHSLSATPSVAPQARQDALDQDNASITVATSRNDQTKLQTNSATRQEGTTDDASTDSLKAQSKVASPQPESSIASLPVARHVTESQATCMQRRDLELHRNLPCKPDPNTDTSIKQQRSDKTFKDAATMSDKRLHTEQHVEKGLREDPIEFARQQTSSEAMSHMGSDLVSRVCAGIVPGPVDSAIIGKSPPPQTDDRTQVWVGRDPVGELAVGAPQPSSTISPRSTGLMTGAKDDVNRFQAKGGATPIAPSHAEDNASVAGQELGQTMENNVVVSTSEQDVPSTMPQSLEQDLSLTPKEEPPTSGIADHTADYRHSSQTGNAFSMPMPDLAQDGASREEYPQEPRATEFMNTSNAVHETEIDMNIDVQEPNIGPQEDRVSIATAAPVKDSTMQNDPANVAAQTDSQAESSSAERSTTTPSSVRPVHPKTPQEITLAELKAEKAVLLDSLAALPAIQVLMEENESSDAEMSQGDGEPTKADVMAAANKIVKDHIKLLHEYNELKDVGQGLMGLIADQRGVRIVEVQDEFGIDAKD